MDRFCKKCLLLEAGENAVYKTVSDYLETIDDSMKVSDEEYEKRLSYCKRCEYLISGMCRKCGCYIEVRAALKNKDCPDYPDKKW